MSFLKQTEQSCFKTGYMQNTGCGFQEGGSRLFLVTGNSGSGKDSLMAESARIWPGSYPEIIVAGRYITRPPHISEPFVSVSVNEFEKLRSSGFFCMSWKSYGLQYGVPKEIEKWLNAGHPVLVNVSRSVISYAKSEYPCAKVIFVSACLEAVKKRLTERGRENYENGTLGERILKASENMTFPDADVTVDNSGKLEDSAVCLVSYIASRLEEHEKQNRHYDKE